ncbi:MAG: DUF2062 domain-containing protein [Desulfomonilaceae bacterium]
MTCSAVDLHDSPRNPKTDKSVEPRARATGRTDEAGTESSEPGAQQGGASTGLWARSRAIIRKNVVDPLVFSRHPPWFDAAGVSLGLVIGFGVPMGGHVVSLGLLRLLFRFNFILAFTVSSIVNPFTIIPLYYGYYWLGSLVLGRPVAMNFDVFQRIMNPVLDKAYFWDVHAAFIQLGWEILVRWLVTAAILASVSGALGYVITLRLQKKRCMRKAQMLGIQYENYVEELEKNAQTDEG